MESVEPVVRIAIRQNAALPDCPRYRVVAALDPSGRLSPPLIDLCKLRVLNGLHFQLNHASRCEFQSIALLAIAFQHDPKFAKIIEHLNLPAPNM